MYSYIVFDITALREKPRGNSVEIARIHSEWQFTGHDQGVERIEIPSAFTEILLQKKHKSNIITCVAVERYLYAGKDARETITTLRMGTIYRGNYRILYQLFVSTDQFLYGEWWKEETQKNTTIKTNNLVYIGQQLIDAENGGYIWGICGLLYKPFFYINTSISLSANTASDFFRTIHIALISFILALQSMSFPSIVQAW